MILIQRENGRHYQMKMRNNFTIGELRGKAEEFFYSAKGGIIILYRGKRRDQDEETADEMEVEEGH